LALVIAVAGNAHWSVLDVAVLRSLRGAFLERRDRALGSPILERQYAASASSVVGVTPSLLSRLFVTSLPPALTTIFAWTTLLWLYPHQNWVRSIVHSHEYLARVFLLLFPLMVRVPAFARRLLLPHRSLLRKGTRDSVGSPYYTGITVEIGGTERNISEAIPRVQGRIAIEGDSGSGKSFYLERVLALSSDPVVFLPARECSRGVIAAIQARLPESLQRESLITSLLECGALVVVVDGLNEVAADTRNHILTFAHSAAPRRLVIATQPTGIKWPAGYEVIRILPIQDRARQNAFLSAFELPEERIIGFLESIDSARYTDADRRAFGIVLRNPHDLSTAAEMLLAGRDPNLHDLIGQQFSIAQDAFQKVYGRVFPIAKLVESYYQRFLNDDKTLDSAAFPDEVATLADHKLVFVRTGEGGPRYIPRHEKVGDYLLVHAIRRADRRTLHVSDSRFRHAYLYMAMISAPTDREDLRSLLNEKAVETHDTSLAADVQSLIRELSASASPAA
jgi:hypothetical protein